jgi:hypothetical protein
MSAIESGTHARGYRSRIAGRRDDWRGAVRRGAASRSLALADGWFYDSPSMSRTVPHGEPEARDERSRRRSVAIFKVGDVVASPPREGWVGEVVDISRLGNGFVTVRWRTSAGTSLQSMEERVDYIVLMPPTKGGAAIVARR